MRGSWAWVALGLCGCGGEVGSYQGRATWSVDLGQGVQNSEQVEVRQVVRGDRSDLVVLAEDCDLPANQVGQGRLAVLTTSCVRYQGGQKYDLVLSGEGALGGGEKLSLELSGPITVTEGDQIKQGTYHYYFEGNRL